MGKNKFFTNILSLAMVAAIIATSFYPASFSKYAWSTPFNMLVYAPQAFSSTTSITLKPGYYYIEAWGGNGGSGASSSGSGGAGGTAIKTAALYDFQTTATLNIYVGSAGAEGSGTTGGVGGTNGSAYANGGAGGAINTNPAGIFGGAGGGGGAASLVLLNTTDITGAILVAGGGGGGGGSAGRDSNNGGNGGNSEMDGGNGLPIVSGVTNAGGQGGGTSGAGGAAGESNGNSCVGPDAGESGSQAAGGIGGISSSNDGGATNSTGGGGGGGGGGWPVSGGGGGWGDSSSFVSQSGGGGGGGKNYNAESISNPSFSLPDNLRPNQDGYVIITPFGTYVPVIPTSTMTTGFDSAFEAEMPLSEEGLFSIFFDVNGGVESSVSDSAYGLCPGRYSLRKVSALHAGVEENSVVFIGWTITPDPHIYEVGDILPETMDEVTIWDDDVTVYALWSYGEEPDKPLLPEIPLSPVNPGSLDDEPNTENDPTVPMDSKLPLDPVLSTELGLPNDGSDTEDVPTPPIDPEPSVDPVPPVDPRPPDDEPDTESDLTQGDSEPGE